MGESLCFEHVSYTYYTGENNNEPHGPNCHKCMNHLFNAKKLEGVSTFYIATIKGVLTFSLPPVAVGKDAQPFNMKCISENILRLECVSCARGDSYLKGISDREKNRHVDFMQRIECAEEETIVLAENDDSFGQISVKVEDDFVHIKSEVILDDDNIMESSYGSDTRIRNDNNTLFDDGNYELTLASVLPQIMKQEVAEDPESYFDNLMDLENEQTNIASTSGSSKTFTCYMCGWGTNCKRNLSRHLNRHSRLQPFDCKFCGKGFVSTTEMKVHVQRKHETDPEYQCFLCHLLFQNETELKAHMPYHANDVTFDCLICLRRFYVEDKLKEHMKKHNENKQFKCHICDKGFLHKRDMLRHITRHADSIRYHCDLCSKTFSRNDGLRRHNILVHQTVDGAQ